MKRVYKMEEFEKRACNQIKNSKTVNVYCIHLKKTNFLENKEVKESFCIK